MRTYACAIALLLVACSPPAATTEASSAPVVDPAIAAVVEAAMPGVQITGGEADGEGEYEVAGTLNGEAYEFDLMGPDGGWRVVEIQRDIAWVNAPEAVRLAAMETPHPFEPQRVIESRQPADGSVIYELFAPAAPDTPSMEVRYLDGEAAVMPPPH